MLLVSHSRSSGSLSASAENAGRTRDTASNVRHTKVMVIESFRRVMLLLSTGSADCKADRKFIVSRSSYCVDYEERIAYISRSISSI